MVNWYITSTGGKISKSKGGAEPIPDAAERFGVDAMRLFYAHVASLFVDVAWEDEKVGSYTERVEKVMAQVEDLMSISEQTTSGMDSWLDARLQSRVASVNRHMEDYDVRSYANEVFFEMPQDFRWYLRRGGRNSSAVRQALETWVTLMAPITPHVAEELWERLGKAPFVSTREMPQAKIDERVLSEEAKERMLERLIADVGEIVKVTGMRPAKIVVMTSPSWKRSMLVDALSAPGGKPEMSKLIKAAMSVAPADAKKEVPAYAKELAAEAPRMSEADRRAALVSFDELETVRSAAGFLSSQFGCEVSAFVADDPARHDPKGKARFSKPGRPAIYME